ncbi:MAG: M20/M25/M40 family metallo-hydrolase [Gemmatimonadales bacterium]|nr:MAG: M20/M25/M40 family metallo-hydrolase [Gemmatimonadales bacterium]
MCRLVFALPLFLLLAWTAPGHVQAQTLATDDPVLQGIWERAMHHSQVEDLAQALIDSVGPRLVGTPGIDRAHDWMVQKYAEWGVEAENRQYGTWQGWRRGISHIDMLEPWVRSLEGINLAWSPGTDGPVTGDVVVLPALDSPEAFEAWLPSVAGRFVMISLAPFSCRPESNWEEHATTESLERYRERRAEETQEWNARIQATGLNAQTLPLRLEEAGAAGLVTINWSGGWGTNRVFSSRTREIPTFELSCEDYGMLFRQAARDQGPVLRVNFEAEFLGEVPVFNTIATIPGTELPDEYVVLSAHVDTWDGAPGAVDNGTGVVLMMEAVRILREVYPNPRRTILVGHWGGEEQGLNGSRAFAEDHPEVVEGMQVLLNQDNGTGRIVNISLQGFTEAPGSMANWLAQVPQEVTRHINLTIPGMPSAGGTDHAAFVCFGAPALSLSALPWDYFTYTWHTNRDTFDKIVLDDLKNNVVLVASLAYLASQDPERVSRQQRTVFPVSPQTGQPMGWPSCQPATRSAPW